MRSFFQQVWRLIKDYRFKSIWFRYFIILSSCLVLPMTLIGNWFIQQQREQTYQEIIKLNESSLETGYTNIHSIVKSAKNMSFSISRNNDVQYFAAQSNAASEMLDKRESISEMLAVTCNANIYIDSIYVYFHNSGIIITNLGSADYDNFQDREVLKYYTEDMPKRTVVIPRIKSGTYPYLITVMYPVVDSFKNVIGMSVVNLDVEKIGDYFGSGKYRLTEYTPRLFIFNEDKSKLVYSDEYRFLQEPDELYALTELEAESDTFSGIYPLWNSKYVVSATLSEDDGLQYYYVSSLRELEAINEKNDERLIQSTIMTMILCFIIGFLLSLWVYRPIQQTLNVLSEVSMLGGLNSKRHGDEIDVIQQSIISAKKEKDALNLEMEERMLCLNTAQITALQAQINPHFLFNTLETIASEAACLLGEENTVTDMICTLAKLMRISLTNTNYIVSISEELEHVALYLKLFDFRFHDRITLHTQIPEELSKEKISKLTLQPLIENSIQHGLKNFKSGGEIWITGEKKGTDDYIFVEDNGVGVTPEQLEELNASMSTEYIQKNPETDEHIGLSNVNRRIKLIFGEGYGIKIENGSKGGFRVVVHFRSI